MEIEWIKNNSVSNKKKKKILPEKIFSRQFSIPLINSSLTNNIYHYHGNNKQLKNEMKQKKKIGFPYFSFKCMECGLFHIIPSIFF